ncbi:hypothetical protein Thiowin_03836 [Thiorhodovibrio winogradskyi]|uniref:Uncharacterized protein n=1 Tax=Thiorhodovibrio winogradskyi TaxID=77007 RepID=A0ABZ0SFA6_9GAMM|nr:hypothetical protein [Thiorhodovibrio winogradskyi]
MTQPPNFPHQPSPVQTTQGQPMQAPCPAPRNLCADLTQMAIMGAVIGASGAAGQEIRALQLKQRSARQAVRETLRVAAISAAASAVAGAAAHAVSSTGLTRLAVLLAAGTAVVYAADSRAAASQAAATSNRNIPPQSEPKRTRR